MSPAKSLPSRCIFPWDETRAQAHANGFALPFVDEACGARQMRMHVSIINPGLAVHPPHAHAGEEIMFILEGNGEVTLDHEKRSVGPMTALFYPEHVLHGLRNTGPTPIKYIVIRVI